jgi:hypothetical protein
MDSGLTASDVLALTKNNEDGFMGGNSWAWLIIILLFAGGGNFGFGGNRGNCATQEDVADGFSTSTILSNQRDMSNMLFGLQNGMNQGFSGINTAILTSSCGIERAIDACCCKTNGNIDALKYEMAKGFCDVITNANNNTAQILNYFKDDKIHELELKNQALAFQLSQNAQSTTIIDALKTTA